MLIKENRVCAYRTLTHRNIEDWRKHMPADTQGPWAVHCLEHGLRKFVSTYREAKDLASMPASCSFCEAFDQRCVYCPSSRERWSIDAMTGFTPSTGQIMGTAVCSHHKYGAIPDHIDFLEIASYVYSADCATPRGKKWTDDDSTEPWSRDLSFVIPVREPEFWGRAEIQCLLEEILNFLSNDKYSFNFVPLKRDRSEQPYFEFGDLKDWPFHAPDRVIMFSGGLDSLAGAVETAATGGKLVLVWG